MGRISQAWTSLASLDAGSFSVNLILSIQYRHADRWLFPDILSIDQAVSSAGLGPR
jgi:hypothetical protein